MREILNSKYQSLNEYAHDNKIFYKDAVPFPNIIIDNFFDEIFLKKVLDEFPNLSKEKNSKFYSNKNEVKFANNLYEDFPENIKKLFDFLNSATFIDFLQIITDIKEKLIADKKLNGGGLHEIKRGGLLKVHSDFNKHPVLELDRRLNVLIYLNTNWKENYGGHLQLWDKEMRECKKKILPIYNRMVIFSTTDQSNHGHPDPLNCPEEASRKSIATYYYSDGRPASEVDKMYIKNKTYFKDRIGFVDETSKGENILKKLIRRFNIYQKLKKIEKKFFRIGRSKKKRDKKIN